MLLKHFHVLKKILTFLTNTKTEKTGIVHKSIKLQNSCLRFINVVISIYFERKTLNCIASK